MNTQQILRTARSITLTPISTPEANKLSRKDYNEQKLREAGISSCGDGMFDVMWDDAKTNETKIGDLFGFVFGAGSKGDNRVEYRRVVAVLPQSARDASWRIPEHAERQVLVLSSEIGQSTWVDFNIAMDSKPYGRTDADGSKRTQPLQGTKRRNIS